MKVTSKTGAFPMEEVSTRKHYTGVGDLLEGVIQAMNEFNREAHNGGVQLKIDTIWLLGRSIPAGTGMLDS